MDIVLSGRGWCRAAWSLSGSLLLFSHLLHTTHPLKAGMGQARGTAPPAPLWCITPHLSSTSPLYCEDVLAWLPDPFGSRTWSQSWIVSPHIQSSGFFTQRPALLDPRPGVPLPPDPAPCTKSLLTYLPAASCLFQHTIRGLWRSLWTWHLPAWLRGLSELSFLPRHTLRIVLLRLKSQSGDHGSIVWMLVACWGSCLGTHRWPWGWLTGDAEEHCSRESSKSQIAARLTNAKANTGDTLQVWDWGWGVLLRRNPRLSTGLLEPVSVFTMPIS